MNIRMLHWEVSAIPHTHTHTHAHTTKYMHTHADGGMDTHIEHTSVHASMQTPTHIHLHYTDVCWHLHHFQSFSFPAAFHTCVINVNNRTVRFEIWDTGGISIYKRHAPMYYKKAHAVIVIYDITSMVCHIRSAIKRGLKRRVVLAIPFMGHCDGG